MELRSIDELDMGRLESNSRLHEHRVFLTHPPAAFSHDPSRSIDDKPLARQKRKRTSPEDQITLEAAYKRDPKPDKVARLELVKQVALGEKEVQIWFQNRRQSSRRKSRPLLPHEIAQYQLAHAGPSSLQLQSSDPPHTAELTGESQSDGLQAEAAQEHNIQDGIQTSSGPESILAPSAIHPSATDSPAPDASTAVVRSSNDGPECIPHVPVHTITSHSSSSHSTHSHALEDVANRRSMPLNSSIEQHRGVRHSLPGLLFPREASGPLKKASSLVRLSMSFDGNATVVTKDASSPSPPRASQDAIVASTADSSLPNNTSVDSSNVIARKNLQRSSSGRSRDSRAWEFWCDKDARGQLEEKAERETNGSAADAIGLLRSSSGRNILGPLSTRRNVLTSQRHFNAKRSRLDPHRPTLQRSSTSHGRLQGKAYELDNVVSKAKPKLEYSKSAAPIIIPGNESDKENWSPDRNVPRDAVRPSRVATERSALSEKRNDSYRSPSIKRGGKLFVATDRLAASENVDPENDPELAEFMSGERKSKSPASEEELDCVQGLLSLSQGNWR